MTSFVPIRNPYAKGNSVSRTSEQEMGPQSQRRNSLQKRTYQFASESNKRRKGDQLTLFGEIAFESIKHCIICRARHLESVVPHRGHHELCQNNRRTNGLVGESLRSAEEEKRLQQHFATPLNAKEKFSSTNCTQAAFNAFFAPRKKKNASKSRTEVSPTGTTTTTLTTTMEEDPAGITPEGVMAAVDERLGNPAFKDDHAKSRTPLAMLAFAAVVVDKIVRNKDELLTNYFDGLTMVVPKAEGMYDDPQYHAIVDKSCCWLIG